MSNTQTPRQRAYYAERDRIRRKAKRDAKAERRAEAKSAKKARTSDEECLQDYVDLLRRIQLTDGDIREMHTGMSTREVYGRARQSERFNKSWAARCTQARSLGESA